SGETCSIVVTSAGTATRTTGASGGASARSGSPSTSPATPRTIQMSDDPIEVGSGVVGVVGVVSEVGVVKVVGVEGVAGVALVGVLAGRPRSAVVGGVAGLGTRRTSPFLVPFFQASARSTTR